MNRLKCVIITAFWMFSCNFHAKAINISIDSLINQFQSELTNKGIDQLGYFMICAYSGAEEIECSAEIGHLSFLSSQKSEKVCTKL